MESVLRTITAPREGKTQSNSDKLKPHDNFEANKTSMVQSMIGGVPSDLYNGVDGSEYRGSNGVQGKVLPVYDADAKGTVLQEFYRGTNIFVTGATGFMGKVLVEKLLRSCPNINKIFLMVRSKKGRRVEDRIGDLLNSPLFDRLKRESPDFPSKLQAVTGDIGLMGLGIGDADRRLLADNVHVVFNMAATVRFDEKLKVAITMNVRGTRELLTLCRSFKQLKSIVHISSAYSNCPRKEIDECFYPPPIPSEQAIELAEKFDNEDLVIMTKKILGPWPNTYAFTKAVSEDAVKHFGEGLPVGIFRPSIVIATNTEPVGGWIDNLYGPTGVIVGTGSGLLRTMRLDTDMGSNMVPCDMSINGLVASAWDVAQQHSSSSEVLIYNNVATAENELKYADYIRYYSDRKMDYPVDKAIWYYFGVFTANDTMAWIYRILLHYLPAVFVDLFLLLTGKKPMMFRLYQKVHKFTDVLGYFSTQHWTFHYKNIDRLWSQLEPDDHALFNFNMHDLNWKVYVMNTLCGLRLYLGQESPDTLPAAKAKMVRLKWLHYTVVTLFFTVSGWLLWTVMNALISAHKPY